MMLIAPEAYLCVSRWHSFYENDLHVCLTSRHTSPYNASLQLAFLSSSLVLKGKETQRIKIF